MTATVTAIHQLKWGNGTDFQRVTFKLADGSFAKTDLCPSYRNFARWRPMLEVGTIVGNLAFKGKTKPATIDADCQPRRLGKETTLENDQGELF